MEKPTPTEIATAAKVTPAYARMLLNGTRTAKLETALAIYDHTGWKSGPLAKLDAQGIAAARQIAA